MKKFLIAAVIAATAFGAFAAPADDAPSADCDGVKFATGPKGKGYSTLFADIQKVLKNSPAMCELNTTGGLDNLNALSTKEADIGIVQLDTWTDMKGGDDNIAALQAVMPLNSNFLHVVTSVNGVQGAKKFGILKGDTKVINRFSDLRGQRVAVVGSAQLMGRRLDKMLGYGMQFVDVKTDAEAFEMVKSGQVAAAFTVSGWPSGTVKQLTQASGLTLVPFDAPIGEPYKVKALNYKNIAVYNNNTLAVQNVLVTRPFTGQRLANVSAIKNGIIKNLTELKEGNYQPAWNEVNPTAAVPGMTKFQGK
jgi:TRAP-type uncharacterized transport system substrate-binding protein